MFVESAFAFTPAAIISDATATTLNGITADKHGSLWAVGRYVNANHQPRTLTMHDDGGSWQIVPSPSPGRADDSLAAVAAAPNGTIWAVGEYTDGNCQKTLTERYTGGSTGASSRVRTPSAQRRAGTRSTRSRSTVTACSTPSGTRISTH